MAAQATSIDHAAKGYLRHQFIRALAASWLVLLVAGLLWLIGGVLINMRGEGATDIIGYIIGAAIVLLMIMIPVIIMAAAGGAVMDLLHRRLVAFLAFLILCAVIVLAPLGVLGGARELMGLDPPSESAPGIPREWQMWAMIALLLLSVMLAWEGAAWAWWQMTTPREGFLAARGWRPPVWRLFSTFRRHLGLPPFISNFGRGRIGLTLIYFAVAVLNVGLVGLVALPFLAYAEANTDADRRDLIIAAIVLAGLFLLNLMQAGSFFDWLADRRATQLYQQVREWDARAPIVFLRAFDQDDAKLKARTRDPIVKFPAGVGSPRTLDEILLEHASPYGPVIAIGDPRDPTPPLGAARVFVPGEGLGWQDTVKALVGACAAVIMCPNDTAGVRWELDLIAGSGGRVRTIYLANPEIPAAVTAELFARLAPEGEAPAIPAGQTPIAAFTDPKTGWRVLTTSLPPSMQTYVIALNVALQSLLGREGAPLARPKKTVAAKA